MIKTDSDTFGLIFLGEATTISGILLLNILVSGENLPVSVSELVDCQGDLSDGGEEDGSFICTRFIEHI